MQWRCSKGFTFQNMKVFTSFFFFEIVLIVKNKGYFIDTKKGIFSWISI